MTHSRGMDIRQLTPDYAVSPQIAPEDVAAIADAGFTTVICNRPDNEIPPTHHAQVMREAAEAAGLAFVEIPVTHAGLSEEMVAAHREAIAGSAGPTLAYCNSGTRSTVIWLFGAAATTPAAELLALAQDAGYSLDGLAPQLDALYRG